MRDTRMKSDIEGCATPLRQRRAGRGSYEELIGPTKDSVIQAPSDTIGRTHELSTTLLEDAPASDGDFFNGSNVSVAM